MYNTIRHSKEIAVFYDLELLYNVKRLRAPSNRTPLKIKMILYNLVDKFLMREFDKEILKNLQSKKPIVFDIGCFVGNFSRKLRKKLNLTNNNFYLFDANPYLKLRDFKYFNEAFTNKIRVMNFHLNQFFPAAGSSLKEDVKNDIKWNFTRKLITWSLGKSFKSFKVKTNTLDNFCRKKKIKKIDILKIDVEGAELEVLEGGKKILDKTHIIQVEILQNKENFDQIKNKIISLLNNYNFEIIKEKNIWSVSLFSNLKAIDILFVKSKNCKLKS